MNLWKCTMFLLCNGGFNVMEKIVHCCYRTRDAIKEGLKVVDVDGSYLARKHHQLQQAGVNVAVLGLPPVPPRGWIAITENNFKEIAPKIPRLCLVSRSQPLPL